MSDPQKEEQDNVINIEALQTNIDEAINEDLEEVVEEVIEVKTEQVAEVEPEPFDIDAAINSGEHVNLSDKVTPEQAEEAAASRGWNPDGKDKYGHQISAVEFLERSSFFKKNDLLKGDIDEVKEQLKKVLVHNQQIAKKAVEDKNRMLADFKAEKEKLLGEDFLDGDGIARLKEIDNGIEDNQSNDVNDVAHDYRVEKENFAKENDWYGKDRAKTALADQVGTEYATKYQEENGHLPEPKRLFNHVIEEVNKDFPAETEKQEKRVTKVASAQRVVTQTNKPKKKTFADLPEDQRAIAREVIEATGQTEDDYLGTYKF